MSDDTILYKSIIKPVVYRSKVTSETSKVILRTSTTTHQVVSTGPQGPPGQFDPAFSISPNRTLTYDADDRLIR